MRLFKTLCLRVGIIKRGGPKGDGYKIFEVRLYRNLFWSMGNHALNGIVIGKGCRRGGKGREGGKIEGGGGGVD